VIRRRTRRAPPAVARLLHPLRGSSAPPRPEAPRPPMLARLLRPLRAFSAPPWRSAGRPGSVRPLIAAVDVTPGPPGRAEGRRAAPLPRASPTSRSGDPEEGGRPRRAAGLPGAAQCRSEVDANSAASARAASLSRPVPRSALPKPPSEGVLFAQYVLSGRRAHSSAVQIDPRKRQERPFFPTACSVLRARAPALCLASGATGLGI